MPIYVDDANKLWRGRRWNHLVAVPETPQELDKLHALAQLIGIPRKFFQNHRIPHYDLSEHKSELAFRHGAIPVSTRQLIAIRDRQRYIDSVEAQNDMFADPFTEVTA